MRISQINELQTDYETVGQIDRLNDHSFTGTVSFISFFYRNDIEITLWQSLHNIFTLNSLYSSGIGVFATSVSKCFHTSFMFTSDVLHVGHV